MQILQYWCHFCYCFINFEKLLKILNSSFLLITDSLVSCIPIFIYPMFFLCLNHWNIYGCNYQLIILMTFPSLSSLYFMSQTQLSSISQMFFNVVLFLYIFLVNFKSNKHLIQAKDSQLQANLMIFFLAFVSMILLLAAL